MLRDFASSELAERLNWSDFAAAHEYQAGQSAAYLTQLYFSQHDKRNSNTPPVGVLALGRDDASSGFAHEILSVCPNMRVAGVVVEAAGVFESPEKPIGPLTLHQIVTGLHQTATERARKDNPANKGLGWIHDSDEAANQLDKLQADMVFLGKPLPLEALYALGSSVVVCMNDGVLSHHDAQTLTEAGTVVLPPKLTRIGQELSAQALKKTVGFDGSPHTIARYQRTLQPLLEQTAQARLAEVLASPDTALQALNYYADPEAALVTSSALAFSAA